MNRPAAIGPNRALQIAAAAAFLLGSPLPAAGQSQTDLQGAPPWSGMPDRRDDRWPGAGDPGFRRPFDGEERGFDREDWRERDWGEASAGLLGPNPLPSLPPSAFEPRLGATPVLGGAQPPIYETVPPLTNIIDPTATVYCRPADPPGSGTEVCLTPDGTWVQEE